MTLPNMESSELPQEAESSEVQESVESAEVQEEVQQLEQATFEPEAMVETERDFAEAETVENAFAEVVQAAVTEAPVPIVKADDGLGARPEPVGEPPVEGLVDRPEKALSRDGGDVMIDTVPLPENPMEIGEREMIGTWPTPEEPSRMEQAVPSEAVDRVAIIDSNDGPNVKERVGPAVTDDSNIPPPTHDSNSMEIPENLRDGPSGSSDSGLDMQKTVDMAGETSSLPREASEMQDGMDVVREGFDDELKLARGGGEEDKFDPGVEQKFDPHQENRIKDGYGSVAGTAGKDVSGEYQGGEVGIDDPRLEDGGDPFENFVDENGLPINPEKGASGEWDPRETTEEEMNKMDGPLGDVMGVMGEGNRPDPADLAANHGLVTGPQFGIDGTDLRGAASAGADQRAAGILADIASALKTIFGGGGGGGDDAKQTEEEENEAEGQAEEEANEKDEDFMNEYNASKDGTVYGHPSKPGKRHVSGKVTAGLLWGRLSDTLGGGGASEDVDPRGDDATGVRTPDPDGAVYDSGYVEKYKAPPKDSGLVEALKDFAIPERNTPLDPVESMSQPVDEEEHDRERPVNLKESLDASLDPNINWGDDSSGGLSKEKKVNPGEFDADEKLTPPGGMNGEGGVEKPPN
ncbi:MAG: hypothetical protein K8R77_11865 [Anaerolineaceae bacterium]|nr:hypothetical protein [Anaerolineaceae bacterium]